MRDKAWRMTHMEYVGVDGCRFGWFSVGLNRSGGYAFKVFTEFEELLEHYGDAKLVLVDIPIGLPHGPGGRDCDREARRKLRPRGSSVFPTPTRQTVRQAAKSPKDYKSAAGVEYRFAGKRISRQSFAICSKIDEVDALMVTRGNWASPAVREVHPELCFWALNDDKPMNSRKKRKEGVEERLQVLKGVEPRTHDIFAEACSKFPRKLVAKDDILDALAAVVTAYRSKGSLQTVPECPPTDSLGLPMEMVY